MAERKYHATPMYDALENRRLPSFNWRGRRNSLQASSTIRF